MNSRPKVLLFYACVCLLLTLSLPLQIIWLHELSFGQWNMAWSKLTLPNYIVMSTLLALGITAWHGSSQFFKMALLATLAVSVNNYWVGQMAIDYTSEQASLATILFGGFAFSPYAFPKLRKVLLNPHLRWWRSARRYSFQAPVAISADGKTLPQEVLAFDVSRSGMFIQSALSDFYGLEEGDVLNVRWLSSDHEEHHRKAIVVRRTDAKGRYPRGLGVQFT